MAEAVCSERMFVAFAVGAWDWEVVVAYLFVEQAEVAAFPERMEPAEARNLRKVVGAEAEVGTCSAVASVALVALREDDLVAAVEEAVEKTLSVGFDFFREIKKCLFQIQSTKISTTFSSTFVEYMMHCRATRRRRRGRRRCLVLQFNSTRHWSWRFSLKQCSKIPKR